MQAGALDDALRLVATAEAGVLSELEQARTKLLRGKISFFATRSGTAAELLVEAAERLGEVDPELARETYFEALMAAIYAGPLAPPGAGSRRGRESRQCLTASAGTRRSRTCCSTVSQPFSATPTSTPCRFCGRHGSAIEAVPSADRAAAVDVGGDGHIPPPLGRRRLGAAV